MKKNYKKIGNYIRLVDERNKDLKVTTLLGLTINKVFIPSVANTVGTNMANYKVIRKNQFACSLMQVRRDKKIPVALLKDFDEAIISQAYPVFEIIDTDKLLPEYLMMWFSRKEFDREACFYAVGGVRGSLEWEDFCEMSLPVPTIERQKEIVAEYNTIVNRIKLNEELNKKLEETAQAIYKRWFVEFEFPMTKEQAVALGKPELEGKPYKSNGGKMVWNEELGKDVPERWRVGKLDEILKFKNGKKRPLIKGKIPVYGGNGVLDFVSDFNSKDVIVIGRVGAYCGSLYFVRSKCWISDNAICAKSLDGNDIYSFYLLKTLDLNEKSEGTSQPLLTQELLKTIKCLISNENVIRQFDYNVSMFEEIQSKYKTGIGLFGDLKETLLSKIAKG